MKIAAAFVFLSALTIAAAQDWAPDSMADWIYASRPTSESASPQSAILSGNGTRTPINITGFAVGYPGGVGTYVWTKTSPTTGTLAFTGGGVAPSRLEVTFITSGQGTYREIKEGSATVVSGEISLAPVPRDPTPPLINLSVRATLTAGQPAIQGFVVSAGAARRVLVRAIGPSLAQFGVTNPVANPTLTIFKGANQIGANNGWGGAPSLAAVFAQVGAFALPATSRDCAVVLTLDPGNYTVQARGEAGGEVLLEVYLVD